jgi:small subunit ribosomal protein S27e
MFWGFLFLFEVLDAVIDHLNDSSSKNYLLMKDWCVAIFCGCRTTVFSHSQTVVLCGSCSTVLCQPTGGKARLTEGCSFRKKGEWPVNVLGVVKQTPSQESVHNKSFGCGWAFTNKSGSQLLKMFPQSIAAGQSWWLVLCSHYLWGTSEFWLVLKSTRNCALQCTSTSQMSLCIGFLPTILTEFNVKLILICVGFG